MKAHIIEISEICNYELPKIGDNKLFTERRWKTCEGSNYFKYKVENIHDAAAAVKAFELHTDIRTTSKYLERELISYLWSIGRSEQVRHVHSGNFDPYKLPQVACSLARNSFNEDAPIYRQTQFTAPKRPHLAVMAGASWAQMWDSEQYIPNCVAIMLALTYAAEALQCTVSCHVGFDFMRSTKNVCIFNLSDDKGAIRERYISSLFHRDMWRMGFLAAGLKDWDSFNHAIKTAGSNPLPKGEEPFWHWNNASASCSARRVGKYLDNMEADFSLAIGDINSEKASLKVSAKDASKPLSEISKIIVNSVRTHFGR